MRWEREHSALTCTSCGKKNATSSGSHPSSERVTYASTAGWRAAGLLVRLIACSSGCGAQVARCTSEGALAAAAAGVASSVAASGRACSPGSAARADTSACSSAASPGALGKRSSSARARRGVTPHAADACAAHACCPRAWVGEGGMRVNSNGSAHTARRSTSAASSARSSAWRAELEGGCGLAPHTGCGCSGGGVKRGQAPSRRSSVAKSRTAAMVSLRPATANRGGVGIRARVRAPPWCAVPRCKHARLHAAHMSLPFSA